MSHAGKQYEWPCGDLEPEEFSILLGADGTRRFCKVVADKKADNPKKKMIDRSVDARDVGEQNAAAAAMKKDYQVEIGLKDGSTQIMRK